MIQLFRNNTIYQTSPQKGIHIDAIGNVSYNNEQNSKLKVYTRWLSCCMVKNNFFLQQSPLRLVRRRKWYQARELNHKLSRFAKGLVFWTLDIVHSDFYILRLGKSFKLSKKKQHHCWVRYKTHINNSNKQTQLSHQSEYSNQVEAWWLSINLRQYYYIFNKPYSPHT